MVLGSNKGKRPETWIICVIQYYGQYGDCRNDEQLHKEI